MKNERYCLHIDDDPDEHELFAQVLANVEPGILCRTALDAGLALDNLKRTTHLPEMIFVDVNMPLMNGFEFISKMKEIVRLQEIPVVFYSTTTDQRQIAQALHHGALAFITK